MVPWYTFSKRANAHRFFGNNEVKLEWNGARMLILWHIVNLSSMIIRNFKIQSVKHSIHFQKFGVGEYFFVRDTAKISEHIAYFSKSGIISSLAVNVFTRHSYLNQLKVSIQQPEIINRKILIVFWLRLQALISLISRLINYSFG